MGYYSGLHLHVAIGVGGGEELGYYSGFHIHVAISDGCGCGVGLF